MKIIKTVTASIITGVILLSLTACFPSTQPKTDPTPSSSASVVPLPTPAPTEIKW